MEIFFEKNSQVFKKLTKNQRDYYFFIIKNLKIIKQCYEDILTLISGTSYKS